MSQLSQSDLGGDGNNESSPPPDKHQLYRYDFVINNYTEEELSQLNQTLAIIAKKAVYGLEIGDSGTSHVQGFLSLKRKRRMTELHQFNGLERASFRPVRNEKACIEYCQKDNVALKFGFPEPKAPPKPIKVIENLYEWQTELECLFLTEPDDRKVIWRWESKGNVGKSAFVKYMFVKYAGEVAFCNGGKASDLFNLIFNTDMNKCKCVMWDIPRSNDHISYNAVESIKNGLICNTKYETGAKAFNPPHIFIFANFYPDTSVLSMDRWDIKELS